MAIDTRDKRASALAMLLPWLAVASVPDGSITGTDKQQDDGIYRGVAAVAPIVIDAGLADILAGYRMKNVAGFSFDNVAGYRMEITGG